MIKIMSHVFAFAGFVILLSAGAQASVVYVYDGPNFTNFQNATPPAGAFDNSMDVTGSFTLATPLAGNLVNADISGLLEAFSFSHDRGAVTNLNGGIVDFLVSTDAGGNITGWDIDVRSDWDLGSNTVGSQRLNVQTCSDCAGGGNARDIGQLSEVTQLDPRLVSSDSALVLSGDRIWRARTIPAPAGATLLFIGLASLAGIARRNKA